MNNENDKHIDCIDLQRKIRNIIVKEANYNIRKLVEIVNENTKDDRILKKYYQRKEKESLKIFSE